MNTYVYTHNYTQRYNNDERQPRPAHAAWQAGGDARDAVPLARAVGLLCVMLCCVML